MSYYKLSPFAKALVMFAYKENKFGRQVTRESFIERFDEGITEKYLEEVMSQDHSILIKNNETYHLSKATETTIRKFGNFLPN